MAAQLRWLWVAVSEQVTFCDILPGRGFDEAASILGADYKGWLTHDGWQVYYKFLKAGHQSCLNHLLDRAKKLIESASARAARFPLRVQEVFKQALALAERYKNKEISLHGLLTATGRLEVKLDRVLNNPAQAVLTSILQTAKQQGKKPFAVLLELLCGRDQHKILDLVPGTREATQDSSRAAKAGGRLLSSTPESAVPRELLALHATSPPVGPVSAAVQP